MLDIDFWTILWTGVNLVVLFLLLRHFLFKPVTAMMEERTRTISDGLAQAEEVQREAQAQKERNDAQLAQVRSQAEDILSKARSQGQREYEQILASAQADAQAARDAAAAQNQAERDRMLREVQGQMVSLALLAASKVSEKSLDKDSDRAMVQAFLSEAGED